MLYHGVLVSAVQQNESVILIYISPLFWISFPFRSPRNTEESSPCYPVSSRLLSILYISSVRVCVLSHSVVSDSLRPHQAPLSMELSRQEYWSRLPFPTAGGLPNPGIKPISLAFPALAGKFFTISTTWKPQKCDCCCCCC